MREEDSRNARIREMQHMAAYFRTVYAMLVASIGSLVSINVCLSMAVVSYDMRSSRYWLGGRLILGRSTVTSLRLTRSLTSISLPLIKDRLRPAELS